MLIKCPECKKKVSDQCENCPHCGFSIKSISQNEVLGIENTETVDASQNEIQNEELVLPKNKKKTKAIIFICGILLLISALLIFWFAMQSNSVEEIRKSVVKINVYDKNGEIIQTGSGFVIFDKNTLITNAHVITDGYTADAITESDERIFIDGAVYYSQDDDIAILKINGNSSIKALDYSTEYKVGDKVIAIGSPLGIKNSVSEGVVSNNLEDGTVQHSAPISSGSSGGTLFNAKGEVIGMNTATITSGQNINLAIPVDKIKEVYEESKNNKTQKINQVQFMEYNGVKIKILNNRAGKNILEITKNNTENLYVFGEAESHYHSSYYLKQVKKDGLVSNWIQIADKSNGWSSNNKDATYREGKIHLIRIIKLNNISDEQIAYIMACIKEELDANYADIVETPYDGLKSWVPTDDGQYAPGDIIKRHYYSQEYINAYRDYTLEYYNGYIYEIVCLDKTLTKEIEAEIKNLP